MTDDTYELMLKVHNVAPFRLIKEAAPFMRSKTPERVARNKSIVTVSSVAGIHGNVGQANYATAKAGVTGLTKTIAKEWGPFGVRCNTVAFGHILTRLTQAKELGETIEVNGKSASLSLSRPPLSRGSSAGLTLPSPSFSSLSLSPPCRDRSRHSLWPQEAGQQARVVPSHVRPLPPPRSRTRAAH